MKNYFIIVCLILIAVLTASCTVSDDYISPETGKENEANAQKPSVKGDYNETYDNITADINGFVVFNGFLSIQASGSLYAYDPENGEPVILCSDPSCDHKECFFGYTGSAVDSNIIQCGSRIYNIRTVPLSETVKFNNGQTSSSKFQIVSADLNGNNTVLHYENADYIGSICPVNDEYMYFLQTNSNEGTYELYKLTYKNNKTELIASSSSYPAPICEKEGYIYYSDPVLPAFGRIDSQTGKDEIILNGSSYYFHFNDNYMWFANTSAKKAKNYTAYRYDFKTGEIVEILPEVSRFVMTDEHIFYTKNEGLVVETADRDYKDSLSGRIYMCDHDGSNSIMIRDDYEQLYYQSFIPYHDKLFAEYRVYDENLENNLNSSDGFIYGYVAIGDTEDYTTFEIK